MKWSTVEGYDRMSQHAADRIYTALVAGSEKGRRYNLGLATGNTMIGLYKLLAGKLNRDRVDLGNLHTYNLDEYVGDDGYAVQESHPLSYRRYMRENLLQRSRPRFGIHG